MVELEGTVLGFAPALPQSVWYSFEHSASSSNLFTLKGWQVPLVPRGKLQRPDDVAGASIRHG